MARPRTRNDVVCQNKNCDFYRKKKGKDIIRRGFNSAGTQMYRCLYCNKYFVETSGTPLYRKRLTQKQIKQLCRALVEKNGVRATARITGHTTGTVTNWHDDLATHAEQVNDFLAHGMGLSQYEVDEFWTTVKKNRKTPAQKHIITRAKAKLGATPASRGTRTFLRRSRSARGRRKPARA